MADEANLDPQTTENLAVPVVEATDDNYEEIRGRDGFKKTKDGNMIVGENGRKYIREEALQEERKQKQIYANTLANLAPHMDAIEETIRTRTHKAAEKAATPESDYTPDELEGYASTMGWYDQGGQPDVKRAKSALDFAGKMIERKTGKAIQPLANATMEEQGKRLRDIAKAGRFIDGEAFADPKTLDTVFDSLPPQFRSDPEVAQAATLIAVGLETLQARKQGGGRRSEPTFRESSGGRFGGASPNLDEFDRAAARARGRSLDDWGKMTKASSGPREDATGGFILEDV